MINTPHTIPVGGYLEVGNFHNTVPEVGGGGRGTITSSGSSKNTVTIPVAKAGTTEQFDFKNDNDVKTITIDFIRRVNKPSITVEKLASKPFYIPKTEGKTYSYLGITKNINDRDIKNIIIKFGVPKNWLVKNGILPEEIVLKRFKMGWTELPTKPVSSDGDNYYYESKTPGMSYFAISTKKKVQTQPPNQEPINTNTEAAKGLLESSQENNQATGETKKPLPKKYLIPVIAILIMQLLIILLWYLSKKKKRDHKVLGHQKRRHSSHSSEQLEGASHDHKHHHKDQEEPLL